MSEPALHMPDVQDPQNKRPMSEPAPHTTAKRHCVSQSAPLEGMPNADWVFHVGTVTAWKIVHIPCLQQIKSSHPPGSNKDLAKAYGAAYGEELAYYPTLFEGRPDWLITIHDVVGCQCTCPTGLQADDNSQVRLEINTTNTRGVADCMAPRKTANRQRNRSGYRAYIFSGGAHSQIQCWSPGVGPLAQSLLNHEPDIDRDCLGHAIPGRALLREWSMIKQNPDTCVCFDMPSCGRTKRGRVEIEEVAQADAYADPPPPSSPAEVRRTPPHPGASAAVAGAAAEPANIPLEENEEVDAYADPPPPSSPTEEDAAYAGTGAPGPAAVAGAAAEQAACQLKENEEVDAQADPPSRLRRRGRTPPMRVLMSPRP